MTTSDTFQCCIITPERKVLECDARFVAFTAHDGEMGVLRSRAPLICKLGIGPLRIETPEDNHVFFIDEGFVEVRDNHLTLLTERASRASELDSATAEAALIEAHKSEITDDASWTARSKAIQRAQVQIKLAGSGTGSGNGSGNRATK